MLGTYGIERITIKTSAKERLVNADNNNDTSAKERLVYADNNNDTSAKERLVY